MPRKTSVRRPIDYVGLCLMETPSRISWVPGIARFVEHLRQFLD